MEEIFSVEAKFDTEFGSEDLVVRYKNNVVVEASRFDGHQYSSVFWDVNPQKTNEECFLALTGFYHRLREGGFKTVPDRGLPHGITFDEDTGGKFVKDCPRTQLPLDSLLGDRASITSHPRFQGFKLLRADTPYCAFTMEDFSGTPWKPETGKLTVISHQDVSEPLTILILATARQTAPPEKLKYVLADLYKYNGEKVVVH